MYSLMQAAGCKLSVKDKDKDKDKNEAAAEVPTKKAIM
jgi:hypothetical protein